MKSLKNSTGGKECNRLEFSSLGPLLEELGITEISLQIYFSTLDLSSESESRSDSRSSSLCSEFRSS